MLWPIMTMRISVLVLSFFQGRFDGDDGGTQGHSALGRPARYVEQAVGAVRLFQGQDGLGLDVVARQALPAPPMPKPVQIRSRIKPIRQLAAEVAKIGNVPAAISEKDPRTVAQYRRLIPELKAAVEDLEGVLERLAFLGEG